MGMLEVIVLATMERMVVTGLELGMQMAPDFRVCRWAKPSHLQYIVHEQESKLVTYVAGSAKSRVYYIMVRQVDKVKVRNVKVIPNKE